jgi:hypothetical protein
MLRAFLAAAAIAAPAGAAVPLDPPARFDYTPSMAVNVWLIDRADVWRECSGGGAHAIRRDVAGCQWFEADGSCVVIVAMRSPRAPAWRILRHELAHCNGWEHG